VVDRPGGNGHRLLVDERIAPSWPDGALRTLRTLRSDGALVSSVAFRARLARGEDDAIAHPTTCAQIVRRTEKNPAATPRPPMTVPSGPRGHFRSSRARRRTSWSSARFRTKSSLVS